MRYGRPFPRRFYIEYERSVARNLLLQITIFMRLYFETVFFFVPGDETA